MEAQRLSVVIVKMKATSAAEESLGSIQIKIAIPVANFSDFQKGRMGDGVRVLTNIVPQMLQLL